MKVLGIDEIIKASNDADVPGHAQALWKIEAAVDEMAKALAKKLKVNVRNGAEYIEGMGGLCVEFSRKFEGQTCPPVLDAADPSGEWE